MIAAGRFAGWRGTFGPRQLGFGETISCEHGDIPRAEIVRHFQKFPPRAVAGFFAAEHEAFQIFAADALLRRLMEQMIDERRHADEHFGLQFFHQPQIALGADDLAAAAADGQAAKRNARVIGEPKRQMGRERKRVEHPELWPRLADFHQPAARGMKVGDVVVCEQKRQRLGGASGGEKNRDGTKFIRQLARDLLASVNRRAQNGAGPVRQNGFARRENEFLESLRLSGRREQIGFFRERHILQIVQCAKRISIQAVFGKNARVVRRERQDNVAQIPAELFRLQLAHFIFRQCLPVFLETARVHDALLSR